MMRCLLHPCTNDSSSLSACRRLKHDAAGAFARARHCCGSDTLPIGPQHENTTSSTKPEVHNVSQHRQTRTEPRATDNICAEKSGEVRLSGGFWDMQADIHAHNTPLPYLRRSNIILLNSWILHSSLVHPAFRHGNLWNKISQCSVATRLRCGEIFYMIT